MTTGPAGSRELNRPAASYTAQRRIHVCMAMPAATPAFMLRVAPYWALSVDLDVVGTVQGFFDAN